MAAAGLAQGEAADVTSEDRTARHVTQLADLALEMREVVSKVNKHSKFNLTIRAGKIDSGVF